MIHAVFAVDRFGGIGRNGSLPWPHNSEDLQYFKELTQGHVVVMGRNTWDDPKMPKPLPNRINIVVTNTPIMQPGVVCIKPDNVKARLDKIQEEFPKKKIFLIGGKTLLEANRDIIDVLHLTQFKTGYNADVRIDLKKFLQGFRLRSVTPGTDCYRNTYTNEDIFR